MANKDKMNSIVQRLEQQVIEHFLATQTAPTSEDGTLNIFPDCKNGCLYCDVCDGKVCSLYLEKEEKPKACQEIDEQQEKLLEKLLEGLSNQSKVV